jgi:hypothetical protein
VLASAIAAVVARALQRMRTERPGISILVREREPVEALAGLDEGDLDIAVSVDQHGAPRRDDPRYHRVDLLTDVLDVLLPIDHAHATLSRIPLEALACDPWVAANASDACALITLGACAAAGFTPGRDTDAPTTAVVQMLRAVASQRPDAVPDQ